MHRMKGQPERIHPLNQGYPGRIGNLPHEDGECCVQRHLSLGRYSAVCGRGMPRPYCTAEHTPEITP